MLLDVYLEGVEAKMMLARLLHKLKVFVLGAEQHADFQTLKTALEEALVHARNYLRGL